MMMTPPDHEKLEPALEHLFESARRTAPDLPTGFLTRLEADALSVQPARPRSFRFWCHEVGGWWGVGSILTAGFAGLWIGIMPPEGLNALPLAEDDVWSLAEDDSSFGWMIEEEEG